MNHSDHLALLRPGIPRPGGLWADFGSGSGAFTLALADLLGPTATIYSVDQDKKALSQQEQAMKSNFPQVTVHYQVANFTRPLTLPPLDGLLMANSLHFQKDKLAVLALVRNYLRPGGRFILIEYNSDQGNPWVPYPLTYQSWATLAKQAGFSNIQQIATTPSRFLSQIYSAVSW